MTDFTYLKKLHVTDDATAEFVFYGIEGNPSLTVKHAGDTNRDFFNVVFKRAKKASRKAKANKNSLPSIAEIEAERLEDVALFIRFIVTDWQNVVDAKGKTVPFSKEDCEKFLLAIPSDMFGELRQFCLDIENFREDEAMDLDEMEDLQGN